MLCKKTGIIVYNRKVIHLKSSFDFCVSMNLKHILLLISHGNIFSRCGFISIHILCKTWAFKLLIYFVVKYNLDKCTTLDDIEDKIFKLYYFCLVHHNRTLRAFIILPYTNKIIFEKMCFFRKIKICCLYRTLRCRFH